MRSGRLPASKQPGPTRVITKHAFLVLMSGLGVSMWMGKASGCLRCERQHLLLMCARMQGCWITSSRPHMWHRLNTFCGRCMSLRFALRKSGMQLPDLSASVSKVSRGLRLSLQGARKRKVSWPHYLHYPSVGHKLNGCTRYEM